MYCWASFNLAKDVNLLADELENERGKKGGNCGISCEERIM